MNVVSNQRFQVYSGFHPSDPSIVEGYLASAQSIVEKYLGYPLEEKVHYYKKKAVWNTDAILCDFLPVRGVSSLSVNGVMVEEPVVREYGVDIDIHRGDSIIMEYTAGYTPFVYEECHDAKYRSGFTYATKDSEGNFHVKYDWEVGDDVEGEVYFQIQNDGEGGLDPVIVSSILRIASLIHTESQGNIGMTGVNLGGVSRSFTNYTSYEKYLKPLSSLRVYPL